MAAGGSSFLEMVFMPDEGILFSTGDLVASHCLLQMPFSWHRHFTFSRRVRGSAVGSNRPWVCMAACVSPVRFSAATRIVWSSNRRCVITLVIERGPVPGDSVCDEAIEEEEAQLLSVWP